MEVHPPHQGIHTWRDFFVHMATICLGLLIALGLEQGVEAVHRAQERHELREALDRDSRQAIVDAGRSGRFCDAHIAWLLQRIKAVQAALAAHIAAPQEKPFHSDGYDIATDPSFQAAKSSGQLGLLSQEEVRAYSEADWLIAYLLKAYDEDQVTRQSLRTFAMEAGSVDRPPDFSTLDAADIRRYRDLLAEELWNTMRFLFWSREIVAVETALLKGQRDFVTLQRIEKAAHTPIPGLTLR
jgi:hypothetical protein